METEPDVKVAFLYDPGNADGTLGGAELTMREFMEAAPEGVEVAEVEEADAVVVGNCTSFSADIIDSLRGKRITRYHHDLARHEHPELCEWLEQNATHIFTSPLHQMKYGLNGVWPNIPPAIDLSRFQPNRQSRRHGKREGNVSIACWQNAGKGAQLLYEWSERNGLVDIYGTGNFAPFGETLSYKGPLDPGQVPEVLWGYERFIFLPSAVEPFGRSVVEAWSAGCKLTVNANVGARYWLEENPEGLESAARDFWSVVL